MRVLALDWGTVRIGAAISDPDGKIAFPLENFIESKNAIAAIKTLIKEKEIGKIIIGKPLALSGQVSKSTTSAIEFGEKLGQESKIDIVFLDERLSSVGATKTLASLGASQKNMRHQVDNLAAAQMLQSYLDTSQDQAGKK